MIIGNKRVRSAGKGYKGGGVKAGGAGVQKVAKIIIMYITLGKTAR